MIEKYQLFSGVISSLYHDIQRIERTEMAKYGLKGHHAQCLLTLALYPEGITAARLCELCEKDKAAISRIVSELEDAGLLHKQEKNGVRYRVPLVLTQTGQAAAGQVETVARAAVEQAGRGLEDDQRAVFYRVLGIIAENLHQIGRDGLQEEE